MSATTCPRCEEPGAAEVHAGTEAGAVLWRVYHCGRCAFTWRDAEPPSSIDPARRPSWAQLKGADLTKFRQLIPLDPGK